jgi:hypothetical protein
MRVEAKVKVETTKRPRGAITRTSSKTFTKKLKLEMNSLKK